MRSQRTEMKSIKEQIKKAALFTRRLFWKVVFGIWNIRKGFFFPFNRKKERELNTVFGKTKLTHLLVFGSGRPINRFDVVFALFANGTKSGYVGIQYLVAGYKAVVQGSLCHYSRIVGSVQVCKVSIEACNF